MGPMWGRYLSRTMIMTCLVLFVAGVLLGLVTYLQRSDVGEQHVAGTQRRPRPRGARHSSRWRSRSWKFPDSGGRKASYPIWVAPFSQSGIDRFWRTTLLRAGASLGHVARALVAVVLAILLLFNFLRAGQQVIAGLDPNFTVNAWGGPTYLGAMLAHYLDGVYPFYLAALFMDLVLLKHDSMAFSVNPSAG